MGDVRTYDGSVHELVVLIESVGRFDLTTVGLFFQRLDTAARRAMPDEFRRPRIEIVEITTGSLVLRLTVAGVALAAVSAAFDAGSFALDVAEYLRTNPAAANSCRALI